jgi:hypothetical protein
MIDPRWAPIVMAVGGKLASSALPDAPVIAPKPRREHRRLHGFAERLMAPRRRLQATRLETEEPCGT